MVERRRAEERRAAGRELKKRKSSSIVIVALIIVVSTIGVGILIYKNSEGSSDGILYSDDPYNSTVPYKLFEPSGLNRTVSQFISNPIYNTLTGDYRPRWTGCTDEEFMQIFGSLPKMPQDFYKKYSMFMNGELTDYDRLGPEYWQQPEFHSLDQTAFNNYLNRPGTGMWTPGTIGCKPSVRQIEMRKGASVSVSAFFHGNVEGSEAYLGTIFYVLFPDAAMNYDGVKIFNQPSDASKYIHASITGPDNDIVFTSFQKNITGLGIGANERLVLFSPTYHKNDMMGKQMQLGFKPSWCYKVTLAISVDKDCPTGTYDIAIDMENPSAAINQEYIWVLSGYPYYAFYFPAPREWRPVCPFFQVIITVV